jgi:6-phosphogluconate dehydrogenase
MSEKKCDIGIIGLGVMGRNLALNIADHEFSVVGYDLDKDKAGSLENEKKTTHKIQTAADIERFVELLERPRAMILLVPAGTAVDTVIESLQKHLEFDDLIIDAGNSNFKDTNRRLKSAADRGLGYLGMGVSGGEKGARYGPSMMPGGSRRGYERVRTVLEAAAAKVNGVPCVAYLGPGSAGHYVKMVHNGIEYGIMQLIAETYDFMKRGMGLTNDRLHEIYAEWNRQELSSYLMEITARIFQKKDERIESDLIDLILDCADQKGTGKWTACDGLNVQEPIPTIDIAVQMRNLSMRKEARRAGSIKLSGPSIHFNGDAEKWVQRLGRALYAAVIITYGQGMAQLVKASERYAYGLDIGTVARIWRGGCIIRSTILEMIMVAFRQTPGLSNLLLDPEMGKQVSERQTDLRYIIEAATAWGIPIPGFMLALAYFDAYRSARLPANLIQAQRDYFGAHTYQRIDANGVFHTEWE